MRPVRLLPLTVLTLVLALPAPAAARGPGLPCLNESGSRYRLVFRPRSCAHFGPGGSFGGGVNLARLQWRGWGAPTARARGIEKGFHLPFSRIRVRVDAYRLRSCRRARAYTRLRATSRFGTTVVRMRACPGRA